MCVIQTVDDRLRKIINLINEYEFLLTSYTPIVGWGTYLKNVLVRAIALENGTVTITFVRQIEPDNYSLTIPNVTCFTMVCQTGHVFINNKGIAGQQTGILLRPPRTPQFKAALREAALTPKPCRLALE